MGGHRSGDPVALVLDRLDTIIELLRVQIGGAASSRLASIFPDIAALVRAGQTPAALGSTQNLLLEYLIAAGLPSAPANPRTISVGIVEELLASNESQPLMRVDITNLNVAQPLTVGKRGVTTDSGQLILARETAPFVLPQGASLYGIVALGTVLVTVSEGYDIRPILQELFAAGG